MKNRKTGNRYYDSLQEILKRLDKIEAILKRIMDTNAVDDVRFAQAPHKTAKQILEDYHD